MQLEKNGIRDACSTTDIEDMHQMMSQMMPQTCPR